MKKKSQAPQQPLPPSFSSSSSEEGSSSSDDDTSSQQLSPNTISKAPPSNGSVKAKPSSPPSESTEETDDESEASGSEDIVAPTPPPPSKKRKSSSSKAKEPEPKPKLDPSSTAAGSGRKIFQRLWTDEDELALVEGLAKYHEKHGKGPSNLTEFSVLVDDMKGRLHIDFAASQIMTKVRLIKKKYANHLVSNTSVKENDKKCFSVLKKIWGDELKVKPTSSKKQIKENEKASGEDVAMLDTSSSQKKKMKAVVNAQVADNQQFAENQVAVNEVETEEDVDILEDAFDRQYVEAPFKRRLRKVLLSLDPKEKQHWTNMLVYNMKMRSKIETDFMQSLWNKQEKENEKKT